MAGDEHEPAVGVLRRRVGLVDADDQLAPEAAVRRTVVRSSRRERNQRVLIVAAADERVGPDVEDVGEVGFDRDLDRQPDRAAGVVDDVEVLVDAARHRPVDADAQGVAVDEAGVVEERIVRVLEAGREELDRGRVEEDRPAAVDPQLVRRDEPGVAGEEAVVRAAGDPPVGLADEESVVAVDRDRRWADLDRERHVGEATPLEGSRGAGAHHLTGRRSRVCSRRRPRRAARANARADPRAAGSSGPRRAPRRPARSSGPRRTRPC